MDNSTQGSFAVDHFSVSASSVLESLRQLDRFAEQVSCGPWHIPFLESSSQSVSAIRLDKVSHLGCVELSGNKLFKLLPNLSADKNNSVGDDSAGNNITRSIISFGGQWSNSIWSLSAATAMLNLQLHVLVRGERKQALTPTLRDAQACGARLHFVPRNYYDQLAYSLDDGSNQFARDACSITGTKTVQVIPSGGSNALGGLGAARLGAYLAREFPATDIYCAAGTGGFSLGLALGIVLEGLQKDALNLSKQTSGIQHCNAPKIFSLCVAEDSKSMLARNQQLLQSCINLLREQLNLLESFGVNQSQLERSNWDISMLPLQFVDQASSFKSRKDKLDDFHASLESINQESIDSIYMLPLSHYISQHVDIMSVPRERPVLILHTGGQQGARSKN